MLTQSRSIEARLHSKGMTLSQRCIAHASMRLS